MGNKLNPWVNSNGNFVHPRAPSGGGGPGGFTSYGRLGSNIDLHSPIPHPRSPAARSLELNEKQKTLFLAYNAEGHQYISTKAIEIALEELPPKLLWIRHFLSDTATPTVYRDMTDIWTRAHWRAETQKHHFMRANNQTEEQAYRENVEWIRQNAYTASSHLRRIWKEQLGYYDPIFVTEPLGDAFHALQDSFSAAHVSREKLDAIYVITKIYIYDKRNKETHSELDKQWQSDLGKEAIIACRELTKIIVVAAIRKSDGEFEERWRSLWGTLGELFLATTIGKSMKG
jgi:hypothetical protein